MCAKSAANNVKQRAFRLDSVIRTFLAGYCTLRSLRAPCSVVERGPLFGVREQPPVKRERKRLEWFASAGDALDAMREIDLDLPRNRQIRSIPVGNDSQEAAVKQMCKAADYRLGGSEFIFVRGPGPLPRATCAARVRRVTSESLAQEMGKLARATLAKGEHLSDPKSILRLYGATIDGRPVGWVQSLRASRRSRYVANLFTRHDFRRQGIATALMTDMLADDFAMGATSSVLLSSHSGRNLYAKLGYIEMGKLLMFWGRN